MLSITWVCSYVHSTSPSGRVPHVSSIGKKHSEFSHPLPPSLHMMVLLQICCISSSLLPCPICIIILSISPPFCLSCYITHFPYIPLAYPQSLLQIPLPGFYISCVLPVCITATLAVRPFIRCASVWLGRVLRVSSADWYMRMDCILYVMCHH